MSVLFYYDVAEIPISKYPSQTSQSSTTVAAQQKAKKKSKQHRGSGSDDEDHESDDEDRDKGNQKKCLEKYSVEKQAKKDVSPKFICGLEGTLMKCLPEASRKDIVGL